MINRLGLRATEYDKKILKKIINISWMTKFFGQFKIHYKYISNNPILI